MEGIEREGAVGGGWGKKLCDGAIFYWKIGTYRSNRLTHFFPNPATEDEGRVPKTKVKSRQQNRKETDNGWRFYLRYGTLGRGFSRVTNPKESLSF